MAAPASEWTDDLVEELLSRMESGETITSIAKDPRMPSYATIWRWEDKGDELSERITRARERGYQARADAIMERVKVCADPQKGRLEFDAERWYLGKMQPKRFGDKLDLTSGGDKIGRDTNEVEAATRLAALASGILNRGLDGTPD
jgi:hypothetical protein